MKKYLVALLVAVASISTASAGAITSTLAAINGPVTVDIQTASNAFEFVSSVDAPGVYKLTQTAGPTTMNLLAALTAPIVVSASTAANGSLGSLSWDPVTGAITATQSPTFTVATPAQLWAELIAGGVDFNVVLETTDNKWTRFNFVADTTGFAPGGSVTWNSLLASYAQHPERTSRSEGGADFTAITGLQIEVPMLALTAYTDQPGRVPEPATLALTGLGFLAIGLGAKRNGKAKM